MKKGDRIEINSIFSIKIPIAVKDVSDYSKNLYELSLREKLEDNELFKDILIALGFDSAIYMNRGDFL